MVYGDLLGVADFGKGGDERHSANGFLHALQSVTCVILAPVF